MTFSRSRTTRFILTTASLLALACGSSDQYPQTTFEPVTEFGRLLNSLFANTFWWTIGIMVLVEVLLVIFVFRYRERPGAPEPKHIHGHVGLEITWTLIPAIIVLFIAVPTIRGVFATYAKAPEDAMVVEVVGHQWWWEFRYPQLGISTANELVLPVNRTVDLHMHSADVIHSFWIPRLGGKRDVNPQPRPTEKETTPRVNRIVVNVEKEGYYSGQCAEYCGTSHALMRAAVHAMSEDDFESWTAGMRTGAPATAPAPSAAPAATAPVAAAPAPAPAQQAAPAPVNPMAPTGAPAPGRGVDQALGPIPPGTMQMAELMHEPPLEEVGKQLFTTRACVACHTIAGTTAQGKIGPDLTRFGARRTLGAGTAPNTLENLERWITKPQDLKPGTLMPGTREGAAGMPGTGLSPSEVKAVATYLKSLN